MKFVSTVAAPVVVEGRLWGVMTVADDRETLPPDTEERVERFTELVATAIANAESRSALCRLVGEQTALRRVATQVARGLSPAEIFNACVARPSSPMGRFASRPGPCIRFWNGPWQRAWLLRATLMWCRVVNDVTTG
jgi:hypothetical protein